MLPESHGPPDLRVAVSERDHARGSANARVTLLEYADFDCPFCTAAYPVVHELLRHFSADLRHVYRHNPRGELHHHARLAAQAAEAAALQDQFWPMHDILFEHSGALEEPDLISYATELDIDMDRFTIDLHSDAVVAGVRDDEIGGLHSGVIGTPTFFVNGSHFRDKPDFESLSRAIQAKLAAP
jgi:protein-disulfide isomerase